MHALIIEDEDVVAMAIEASLRECGFTSFDLAPSEHIAVEAAACRTPDLITSDIRLKSGCGIAAVESIWDGPPVPVVFITGHAAEVVRRHPESHVVPKPYSEATLIAAVASAMLEMSGGSGKQIAKISENGREIPVGTRLPADRISLH